MHTLSKSVFLLVVGKYVWNITVLIFLSWGLGFREINFCIPFLNSRFVRQQIFLLIFLYSIDLFLSTCVFFVQFVLYVFMGLVIVKSLQFKGQTTISFKTSQTRLHAFSCHCRCASTVLNASLLCIHVTCLHKLLSDSICSLAFAWCP